MGMQCSLPWWTKDDGPTSIQHRLRTSAIGAGPNGTVTIPSGTAADLADLLRAAGKAVRRCEAARLPASTVRLQSLVDAEQRAWRFSFFLIGFVAGSGVQDAFLAAWSAIHGG